MFREFKIIDDLFDFQRNGRQTIAKGLSKIWLFSLEFIHSITIYGNSHQIDFSYLWILDLIIGLQKKFVFIAHSFVLLDFHAFYYYLVSLGTCLYLICYHMISLFAFIRKYDSFVGRHQTFRSYWFVILGFWWKQFKAFLNFLLIELKWKISYENKYKKKLNVEEIKILSKLIM